MSKKDQVKFVRSEEFVDVEVELNAAMASLDDVNSKIENLLEGRLDFGEASSEAGDKEDAPTVGADANTSSDSSSDSDSDSSDSEDDDEEYEDDDEEYDDEDEDDEEE